MNVLLAILAIIAFAAVATPAAWGGVLLWRLWQLHRHIRGGSR